MSQIEYKDDGCRGDEELRQWLLSYIEEHPHHTTVVLSRAQYIGISRKALDAYLDGSCFRREKEGGLGLNAGNSNLERKIREFQARVDRPRRLRLTGDFIQTRTWKQLKHACSVAVHENSIVVIYGKSGIGKTVGLQEYALRHMVVQPLVILCSMSVKANFFMAKLAGMLDYRLRATTAKLEDVVAEKLRRTPRAIFVDQANFLSEESLGSLCHIWERASVPIVLAGTPSLYNLFMTSRLTEDVREQITSRVRMHYILSEVLFEEAAPLIRRILQEDATAENVKEVYELMRGSFRNLEHYRPHFSELKRINRERLKSGEVKTREIIRLAASRLMLG
jgi:DNA transposition AAA+ family ATPase